MKHNISQWFDLVCIHGHGVPPDELCGILPLTLALLPYWEQVEVATERRKASIVRLRCKAHLVDTSCTPAFTKFALPGHVRAIVEHSNLDPHAAQPMHLETELS